MKPDRFLIVILAVIGLLVILAVGLFFIRQRNQGYVAEDTPQGVVRNYVLALEKRDYARAYQMLQEAGGKPDFSRFQQAFITRWLEPGGTAVVIQDSLETGDEAVVALTLIHGGSGPFTDSYRETTNALLIKDRAGSWKIERMPYPYWGWDWYTTPAPAMPTP